MCSMLLFLSYFLSCFCHLYCSTRKCQYQFYAENMDNKKLALLDIFCCDKVLDNF